MPNWCFNELTVTGPKESLERFAAAARGVHPGDDSNTEEPLCFQALVPMPADPASDETALNHDDSLPAWWTWRLRHWGTSKDCSAPSVIEIDEGAGLLYHFDTAWAPPTELLRAIGTRFADLTFNLQYCEPGCGVCGTFGVHGEYVKDVEDPSCDHGQEDDCEECVQRGVCAEHAKDLLSS